MHYEVSLFEQLYLANYGLAFPEHTPASRREHLSRSRVGGREKLWGVKGSPWPAREAESCGGPWLPGLRVPEADLPRGQSLAASHITGGVRGALKLCSACEAGHSG